MNIAAYCRVSTDKSDRLNSLEVQKKFFTEYTDITSVPEMTNGQLKQILQKIKVDKAGNVDVYLRLFGDLGLDEAVLIHNN